MGALQVTQMPRCILPRLSLTSRSICNGIRQFAGHFEMTLTRTFVGMSQTG